MTDFQYSNFPDSYYGPEKEKPPWAALFGLAAFAVVGIVLLPVFVVWLLLERFRTPTRRWLWGVLGVLGGLVSLAAASQVGVYWMWLVEGVQGRWSWNFPFLAVGVWIGTLLCLVIAVNPLRIGALKELLVSRGLLEAEEEGPDVDSMSGFGMGQQPPEDILPDKKAGQKIREWLVGQPDWKFTPPPLLAAPSRPEKPKLGSRVWWKLQKDRLLAGKATDSEGFVWLGCDKTRQPVKLYLSDINKPGMVLGSSGSGKTELLKRIIAGLIDLGYGGWVLDMKDDRDLNDFLRKYTKSKGVYYQSWSTKSARAGDTKLYLDPLHGCGLDEARNIVLGSQDFEAAHWAALSKQLLGQLLTVMYDAHQAAPHRFDPPNLYMLGKILEKGSNIKQVTNPMRSAAMQKFGPKGDGSRSEDDYSNLRSIPRETAQAAIGFSARLISIYESQVGRGGLQPREGLDPIRYNDPGVMYIGLDTGGQGDDATILARTTMQRTLAEAAARSDDPLIRQHRFLVLDESAVLHPDQLINMVQRFARAGKTYTIICTQSAMDWGKDVWGVVTQNVNWGVVMKQSGTESGVLTSNWIGQKASSAQTPVAYMQGAVSPVALRDLRQGEGVLRISSGAHRLEPQISWLYCKQVEDPPKRGGKVYVPSVL